MMMAGMLGRFSLEDAERLFLAVKDLLVLADTKTLGAVHKFMSALLRAHPRLIELQGSKIFKLIKKSHSPDDTKLKTFQLYTEPCVEYVAPSKGLFALLLYFFTHLAPPNLTDVLMFIKDLQTKK